MAWTGALVLRFMNTRTYFPPKRSTSTGAYAPMALHRASLRRVIPLNPAGAAAPPSTPSVCALSIPDAQSKLLKSALRIN